MTAEPQFDDYSENYDSTLARSLSVTGESKEYFARSRISWLAKGLKKLSANPQTAMDFGCGIGSTTPHLLELLNVDSVLGIDVSRRCLDIAERNRASAQIRFSHFDDYEPCEEIDLIYTSGVFHHIPLEQRASEIEFIHRALKPGGFLALWENNPWNPGTRYVMDRCDFDKDAIILNSPTAQSLVLNAGLEIVSTSYLFIFPKFLSWLRGIEPLVSGLPLGGQYQVLSRKPL